MTNVRIGLRQEDSLLLSNFTGSQSATIFSKVSWSLATGHVRLS